jgi:hypothetical protein
VDARHVRRLAGVTAALAAVVGAAAFAASPGATTRAAHSDIRDADGVVYRYYAPYGYRFQPLLSLAALDAAVSARKPGAARRLATALLARGVHHGGRLYWEYDFPYGGPVPWTSGFAQAVAALAFARAHLLLRDDSLLRPAAAAFRALRGTLLMPLGGGLWVREYGFTHEAILNAQLETVLSLESYARIAHSRPARRIARRMYVAARTLLPRFDLGACWSRYSLGGAAADEHYQSYHLDLLRRLAAKHPGDRIWRATYVRWSRCLPPAVPR